MQITRSVLKRLLTLSVSTGLALPCWAFDPNAGAEAATLPVAHYTPLPESVVPHRYYSPAVLSASASSAAPTVAVANQPAMLAPLPASSAVAAPAMAPLPETRLVPAEQPSMAATPAYAAPAYGYSQTTPAITPYYAPQPTSAPYRTNRFALGVEGFWDRYREPIADVDNNAGYGGLDGSWAHYYTPNWFSSTELRGSYGSEDYKSISGKINGTDQWEFEGRLLGGYDLATNNGGHIKSYIGLDARYYRDEGKGKATDLGAQSYDRRIFQIMAPIGVTYDVPAYGYHFLPTLEAGPLLFGNVSSRLENIPGYYKLSNQQHSGYELRGDFMMNDLNDQGRGWQFGPFVRYWHFGDSNVDHTPPAGPFGDTDWIEPKNTRLQVGAKLQYLF